MTHESDASSALKRALGRAARSPQGGTVRSPGKGRRRRQAGPSAAGQLNGRVRAWLNNRRRTWLDNRGAWPVRRRLTLFFVLAFLISWLIWPLTLLNPESSPMAP